MGVVKHFVISKICEVLDCVRNGNLLSISMESIFFPNGFLLEGWQSLMQVLDKGGSDVFTQRKFSYAVSNLRCCHVINLIFMLYVFFANTGGAAFCLGNILMEGARLERSHKLLQSVGAILDKFIAWAVTQLQSSGSKPLSMVLPALMVIIPDPHVRLGFDKMGGVGCLSRHLRFDHLGDTRATVQQLYEISFCIWIMSYDVESSEDVRNHFHRDGTVSVLCDLVASSPREKVVRCALATLRNLAACKAEFLYEMVGCGLMKILETLKSRQWTDPDILDGLSSCQNKCCLIGEALFSYILATLHSSRLGFSVFRLARCAQPPLSF